MKYEITFKSKETGEIKSNIIDAKNQHEVETVFNTWFGKHNNDNWPYILLSVKHLA